MGWEINILQLLVIIQLYKSISWSKQVDKVINSKTEYRKLLQSITGRLETMAEVVHIGSHFRHNIRAL